MCVLSMTRIFSTFHYHQDLTLYLWQCMVCDWLFPMNSNNHAMCSDTLHNWSEHIKDTWHFPVVTSTVYTVCESQALVIGVCSFSLFHPTCSLLVIISNQGGFENLTWTPDSLNWVPGKCSRKEKLAGIILTTHPLSADWFNKMWVLLSYPSCGGFFFRTS